MDEVEQAVFDGRRYLNVGTHYILSLTPRELMIETAANVERLYDESERMAMSAMMTRQAYHAKKLKHSDLFKRPVADEVANKKAKESHKRTEEITEWLSQFEEFNGKLGG